MPRCYHWHTDDNTATLALDIHADSDIEQLTALAEIHGWIERITGEVIHHARTDGLSWRRIGVALGVNHQTAKARWGDSGPTGEHQPALF